MQALMILVLLFSLMVAVFAVQNAITVQITFLTWQFETSLVYVILLATALGAVIVGLLGLFKSIKQGFVIKNLKSQNASLAADLQTAQSELDLAKTATSLGLRSKGTERDQELNNLIKGTSPQLMSSIAMVVLDQADLERVRSGLADCAGFYALIVNADQVTLLVDRDYWSTVDTQYPDAAVELGWIVIDLGVEVPKERLDYLQAIFMVLDDTVTKCIIIPTGDSYLIAVPEADSLAAVNKMISFANLNGR
ncbi:MAG: LapA family protein [Firmicutes bacterium]|nr:LapA family protein [Bacillota bacterium]